jgi:hypothetical protein
MSCNCQGAPSLDMKYERTNVEYMSNGSIILVKVITFNCPVTAEVELMIEMDNINIFHCQHSVTLIVTGSDQSLLATRQIWPDMVPSS